MQIQAHSCFRTALAMAVSIAALGSDASGQEQQQQQGTTSTSYSIVGDLKIEIGGRWMYGNIDGYLQTPAGGAPGTTSSNRPTLGELGYNNESSFGAQGSVQWREHIFSLGARITHLSGDARLNTELTSENVVYAPGPIVTSTIDLDWYYLGYQYEFTWDTDDNGSQFKLAPGIQGVLFNFDYDLTAEPNLRSDRNYSKGGLRLGGSAEWDIAGPLSFEVNGWWGVPIDNTAEIMSVELLGRYQLWGGRHMGASLYLGAGWDDLDYEDDQQVPNHIDVEFGPMLILGFELQF